jgi:hypothetical protein
MELIDGEERGGRDLSLTRGTAHRLRISGTVRG